MLCAPGAPFEMATVDIRGIPTRTWKNALPNLRGLVAVARDHGDRLATIYEDERVSYAAQHRAIVALATALAARGIGKGDRVAIAMPNLPEWPVAFFAITALGAIAVPLNAWWTGGELAYALRDSGTTLLIADAARSARIAGLGEAAPPVDLLVTRAKEDLPLGATALEDLIGPSADWAMLPDIAVPDVAIDPEDNATIFYTSGTTGAPKGAVGTHRNIVSNIMAAGYVGTRTVLRRGDPLPAPMQIIGLIVTPLFHVTACSAGLMIAMAAGNTTVYMRKWDAGAAMAIIERERVQVTGGVPTIAWQLLENPDRARFDLSSLVSIGYGGALLRPNWCDASAKSSGPCPRAAGA